MNIFQSTLQGLSDGVTNISDIASEHQKSASSIRNEIKRLKQTQWIKNWIIYDTRADTVRLVKPLLGIGMERLEFQVKQFYNSDRMKGKKFKSHHVEMRDYSSHIGDIDKYLQTQYDYTKKLKDKPEDNGILTI